ncbi:UNVERIFIED_CONTAM: hypothetical protein PYX00_003568 [Menopon gallinae]|uniref:RING-type domain-containing protein n=1 Tax=Menopon gallinae TaxID=328185 RepID=A0AAW2I0Y9_9NEOP
MIIAMSTFLVSAAELSNIFSVLATLIFFVRPDDMILGGAMHHSQRRIPQLKMMKITIPFILKLDESSKSTTCINFSITSQITYTIRVFWGVSVRELHMFLWKPWSMIQKSVDSGDMLNGFYQLRGLEMTSEPHKEKAIISLTFPEPPLDLGTPPRLRYPLVIFIIRNDSQVSVHPYETVALINVVHIKDSVCTLPTSILSQYLKQANGRLCCLKQLYVATGNSVSAEDAAADCDRDDVSVWAVAGEQLCVVCQYYPVSRALMPCRHTCVCSVCFDKLDRCPMCRSPFSSYFTVRNEDYSPRETTPPDLKPTPFSWILNWNDRLINFLGYQ